MDVQIGTLTGTIHAVDTGADLSPERAQAIVAMVIAALDERDRRRAQRSDDTRVTPGLADEQEYRA